MVEDLELKSDFGKQRVGSVEGEGETCACRVEN